MTSEIPDTAALPRAHRGTALVIDAGHASGMSPRFHNLVITTHRNGRQATDAAREDRLIEVLPDLAA